MSEEITLAELADRSSIPARTIRFYIARGLLDGPVKAGRAAAYTPEHLRRLEKIKSLQAEGLTLSEIAARLSGVHKTQTAASSPWWQHRISDDVMVWTRADVNPWRMKQVRSAIDEMMSRLANKEDE